MLFFFFLREAGIQAATTKSVSLSDEAWAMRTAEEQGKTSPFLSMAPSLNETPPPLGGHDGGAICKPLYNLLIPPAKLHWSVVDN